MILNTTRGTCVARHVEVAGTYFKRGVGLMFRSALAPEHGMWIEPCAWIHSGFMRFPFDALFVDKNRKVIFLIKSMKPWRISPWVKGGDAVLELPAGAIALSQTEVGDQLAWDEKKAIASPS